MPIVVAHLPPLVPLLATAVVLLLALALALALLVLLLLLLPQPAATSAVSAAAAIRMRPFIGLASSSGDVSRWSLRFRGLVCDVSGRAVRVEGRRRRPSRPEDCDDAHRLLARVLKAMHRARWKLNAGSGCHQGTAAP